MFKHRLELIAKGLLGERVVKKIALFRFKASHSQNIRLLQSNSELFNIKQGKRCFILGNGPSLKLTDLSLIANEDVFTCNLFAQSKDFLSLNPIAHFIMDRRFFANDQLGDHGPLQSVFDRCSAKSIPFFFVNLEAEPFLSKYKINKSSIHYIGQHSSVFLDRHLTLCDYIPSFPTVIHTAICVAWYMGYQTIYLIGCDCTGFTTYANVYKAKSVSDNYGFELDNSSNEIIQKNMTSSPIQQELRWYAQIFDDYELLYRFCQTTNRQLINLTKGGVLNNIPRANYYKTLMQE